MLPEINPMQILQSGQWSKPRDHRREYQLAVANPRRKRARLNASAKWVKRNQKRINAAARKRYAEKRKDPVWFAKQQARWKRNR